MLIWLFGRAAAMQQDCTTRSDTPSGFARRHTGVTAIRDRLRATSPVSGLSRALQRYAAQSGITSDRLEILRHAFMKTVADPNYLEEANRQKLKLTPRMVWKLQSWFRI
jgi:hypothetical protein